MSVEDLAYHTGASNLWILIECTTVKESTHFKVISATDVVAPREQMHTGKSIKYRIGKTIFDGTIVIISDDKNFLETELVQLQKKALVNKHDVAKKVYKRRRNNDDLNVTPTILNRQSPLPTAKTTNTNESSNQSIIVQTSTNQSAIPPMTFDQQTQTDFKSTSDSTNTSNNDFVIGETIKVKLENIIGEQNNMQQFQIHASEQLTNLSHDCQQMRFMVEEILKRLDKATSVIVEEHELIQQPFQNNEGEEEEEEFICDESTPNKILNFKNDFNNVEIIDYNQDSVHSASNSSHLISNQSLNASLYNSSSNSHTYIEIVKKNQNGTKKTNNKRKANSKIAEKLKSEWNDVDENDGDLQESVPIGNNKTTVPKYILKRINWASHTTATRKLLTSLFTREMLATHSLTGKPSPGTFLFLPINYL